MESPGFQHWPGSLYVILGKKTYKMLKVTWQTCQEVTCDAGGRSKNTSGGFMLWEKKVGAGFLKCLYFIFSLHGLY